MRNDNFIDSGSAENPDNDDYYEEDSGSLWRKGNNGKYRPAVMKKGEVPIFLIIAGLGILAVVAVLLFFDFGKTNDGPKVLLLENKVAQLEAKIDAMGAVSGESKLALENAQELKKVRARFDRLETSLTTRLDHMTKEISRIEKQKKPAAGPEKNSAAATPPKPENAGPSGKIHTVSSGETLYSISRKYNLSVDELLKLNNFEKGTVLKIGQQLKVRK